EVTGPYGAGTVYTLPSANLPLIRMGIALKATRLGQLLAGLIGSARTGKDAPGVWRGLEMFLESQVRADATDLEAVYRNYEKNLRDISRVARKGGARVLFSTVGSNLKDSPPFASLHRPDLTEAQLKEWDGIYAQGVEHESAGDYTEAVKRYLAAAEIDDRYADLHFRLGRCYWAKGEYDNATDRYIRALDLDTLRFRADTRINSIVRDVAGIGTDKGIYLADAAKAFEDSSDHQTPGEELFYEHVHLNFEGTYLLAKTIFEQVQKIVPQQWATRQAVGESTILSQAECAARLAYTDWDKHTSADRILNGFIRKPPFTNQLYQRERLTRMSRDVETLKSNLTPETLALSSQQYRQAIEDQPGDWRLYWKYGKLLAEGLRDYRGAAEQFRVVRRLVPHSHLGHTAMGAVLRGLGDYENMIAEYLKAIKLKADSADSHYYVGWGYRKQGKTDLAEQYYSEAIRLQPDYVPACNDLAEILYRKGKLDEAVATYRRGLIFSPDSPILHGNLGMFLSKQGHTDEAIRELRKALELDPASAKIRKMLESVSKTRD
ncbi:MAG: tetratricopeptide repeat protein, partial [Planctomycetota bacterium]